MLATAPAAATATAPAQQTAAAAGPREITITRWDLGRLGNHLASLRTAAEAATLLGCDLHVPVVPGALAITMIECSHTKGSCASSKDLAGRTSSSSRHLTGRDASIDLR